MRRYLDIPFTIDDIRIYIVVYMLCIVVIYRFSFFVIHFTFKSSVVDYFIGIVTRLFADIGTSGVAGTIGYTTTAFHIFSFVNKCTHNASVFHALFISIYNDFSRVDFVFCFLFFSSFIFRHCCDSHR